MKALNPTEAIGAPSFMRSRNAPGMALRQYELETSPKTPLAKAIKYALTRLPKARPYLDHGVLDLDAAERAVRSRPEKLSIHGVTEAGGDAAAIAYTLIETEDEPRLARFGRQTISDGMLDEDGTIRPNSRPGAALSRLDPKDLQKLIEQYPRQIAPSERDLGDEAVPGLVALWNRFKGFGIISPLPEQRLALQTLGEIGTLAAQTPKDPCRASAAR